MHHHHARILILTLFIMLPLGHLDATPQLDSIETDDEVCTVTQGESELSADSTFPLQVEVVPTSTCFDACIEECNQSVVLFESCGEHCTRLCCPSPGQCTQL